MVNWIFWGVVIAGNLVLVPYFLYLLLISVAAAAAPPVEPAC